MYTAHVHGRTGREYGRVYGGVHFRVCTWPVYTAVQVVNTAVYTIVYTCTRPVHSRVHGRRPSNTAVYGVQPVNV